MPELIALPALTLARSYIMSNTMTEYKHKSYTMVCNHDLTMISEKIEILIRLSFSFPVIVLNMMKLLVIVSIIKLFTQINTSKKSIVITHLLSA